MTTPDLLGPTPVSPRPATSAVIEARVDFPGFHRWPSAPPALSFLAERHRHVFVVRARLRVEEYDREAEFIVLGRAVLGVVAHRFPGDHVAGFELGDWSCEMLAAYVLERLNLASCSVHEDDENGAIVART